MYIYKKKDVKNSIFTKLRDKVVISKVISIIFYYFFFFYCYSLAYVSQ